MTDTVYDKKNTLDNKEWEILLERISMKKCTPFIGAGACHGTLPMGGEIAKKWAKKYKYPLKDQDDLARVAQYLAVDRDDMFPKDLIQQEFEGVAPPDFSKPDEPHALLADLKLPIYITTNYDSFMTQALKSRQVDPQVELCRWNKYVEKNSPSVFKTDDYKPKAASPLVYHLHGHHEMSQSMVLTEDDYLAFLAELSKNQALLPPPVLKALTGTSLLFIGYSLNDWNFRVLFRGLIESLGASLEYTSIAVQLTPDTAVPDPADTADDNVEKRQEKAQQYLDKYFAKIQKIKVKVFWGDIKDFTAELRKQWEGFEK